MVFSSECSVLGENVSSGDIFCITNQSFHWESLHTAHSSQTVDADVM